MVIEQTALGTAGALRSVEGVLDDRFLIVYGDIFLDLDIASFAAADRADPCLATLLVRESDHPWDSHLVDVDQSTGAVRDFVFRQEPGRLYRNLGNAALYIAGRQVLDYVPTDRASDFGKDVFPAALAAGEVIRTYHLPSGEFVKDMGTPSRLEAVETYLRRRAMADAARRSPGGVKVVFLDRDGTLNRHDGLVTEPSQLTLLPGAGDAVRRLNEAGVKCYVVTNQPQIARGLCSVSKLDEIHAELERQLAEHGAHIDGIYYSPFHPETHHGDGVPELRRASDCRKPAPGMIFRAVEEHGLNLGECLMVGDTANDIQAGVNAGIRTVLVGGGELPDGLRPTMRMADLAAAGDELL